MHPGERAQACWSLEEEVCHPGPVLWVGRKGHREQKALGVPGTSEQDGARRLLFLSEQCSKQPGLGVCDKEWEQGWGLTEERSRLFNPGERRASRQRGLWGAAQEGILGQERSWDRPGALFAGGSGKQPVGCSFGQLVQVQPARVARQVTCPSQVACIS